MLTVRDIERAISQLPSDDLVRFREWFDAFDAKVWDKQFEKDTKSGRLDKLANQAIADFHMGKFKERYRI